MNGSEGWRRDLEQRTASLSSTELLEIVEKRFNEYGPMAMEIFKEEIERRGGMDIVRKKASGEMAEDIITIQYREVKDPSVLTSILRIFTLIYLAALVFMVISHSMQLNLLASWPYSLEAAKANEVRQTGAVAIYMIVAILTGIIFFIWLHLVNRNCHAFGASGMRFTPGWAIGYFFIPVANFFMPFKAMKEIWQASKDPHNWQNQTVSGVVAWWWGLWLTSGFLAWILAMSSKGINTIDSLKTLTVFLIIDFTLDIIFAIVVIAMVSKILNMQKSIIGAST